METNQNLLIVGGKIVTAEASACNYNPNSHKYDIEFKAGKVYSYNKDKVVWILEPRSVSPVNIRVWHDGRELYQLERIYVFKNGSLEYWHICFQNGTERDYDRKAILVTESCLADTGSSSVLSYLKQTAEFSKLQSEDGTKLLTKQYEKLSFVSDTMAFSTYTSPQRYPIKSVSGTTPIYPFGCNASQFLAVKNALNNQFSVIEGPPGTGKTQTILNIIANLIVAGKTVQVVSNNNSATANILEKLASAKYDMDFVVAPLGNSENKSEFVRSQNGKYPVSIRSWASDIVTQDDFFSSVHRRSEELGKVFSDQERLASITLSLQDLNVEIEHFHKYLKNIGIQFPSTRTRKGVSIERLMLLWNECQGFLNAGRKLSLLFKLKCRFVYGIGILESYSRDASEVLALFQQLFYSSRHAHLMQECKDVELSLKMRNHKGMIDEFTSMSMKYLRAILHSRYGNSEDRRVFNSDDLWKNPRDVQKEYPIVLSTTFSARSSLGSSAEFDYIIVDEASQVDVATGALALSCAKNAVIVGDSKQLPNVVTEKDRDALQMIFYSHKVSEAYNFATKSFLQSVCEVLPETPKTLLREHYRCHPKIANFFNQKFYGGNLLIMTKDSSEEEVISVFRTTPGNHERDRMNQRQIDVINREVLPTLQLPEEEIGIIAPYNKQVDSIRASLTRRLIEVATVHKFQGREKDAIVISTVDDEVKGFSDDPNLLNVAVSRAKKRLSLVVSGNKQPKGSNIGDLIDYIDYNNFTVIESSIYSVFDLLYHQYTESRLKYLKPYKKVSVYDSENLMYALIKEVLAENVMSVLDVVCHQPLNMLIRDFGLLDEEEVRYAKHGATHLDFMIYNRVGKKPVLAIEVDGYHHHKEGTEQFQRDRKKDHILAVYGIPLLRFGTNGSGEKEILVAKLDEILS